MRFMLPVIILAIALISQVESKWCTSIDIHYNKALMLGALSNDLNAITSAIANCADVNYQNEDDSANLHATVLSTILSIADNSDSVNFLIAAGADVNVADNNGNTALMYGM